MALLLKDLPGSYRFSTNSDKVLEQAIDIAGSYGSRSVRTEHTLIALTYAPQVLTLLQRYDINPESIRGMAQARAEWFRGGNFVTYIPSTGLNSSLGLATSEVRNQPVEPDNLLRGVFKQRAVFATWDNRHNPPEGMRQLLMDVGLTIAGQPYEGIGNLVPEVDLKPEEGEFDYLAIPSYELARKILESTAEKLLSQKQRFILERRYPPKGSLPISLTRLAFGLDTRYSEVKGIALTTLRHLEEICF